MKDEKKYVSSKYSYIPHKFVDENLPNYISISSYANLIKGVKFYVEKKLVIGEFYPFKSDTRIFVHHTNNVDERKLTVFKKEVLITECTEYYNPISPIFKRVYQDGRVVFINNEKEMTILNM